MKLLRWFPVFLALGLMGCATVPMASSDLDAAAKTFTPQEGLGSLYVVRANNYFGGAISFQVIVDGKVVGAIGPGTYYLVELQPGPHSIAATSNENSAKAKFEVIAGANYYFEVAATMGMATARATLSQIKDEANGREMVQGAKRAEGLEE